MHKSATFILITIHKSVNIEDLLSTLRNYCWEQNKVSARIITHVYGANVIDDYDDDYDDYVHADPAQLD